MGIMEFYLANLVIESPTIMPRRRSATGYVGVRETIPGSTLGGAILNALNRYDRITAQEGEELVNSRELRCSPAFPKGKRLLYPAHPFIWQCKEPGCGEYVTTLDTVLEMLKAGREPGPDAIYSSCEKGHRALKKIHPKPLPADILRQGSKGETMGCEEKLESVKIISVPVSRHRASSITGALYSYETIPTALEYWAIISVREGVLDGGLDVLRIGRGVSKGFGKVRLSLRKIDMGKLLRSLAESGHAVLYSISPVVLKSHNYTIDLSSYGELIGRRTAGRVRVKMVYGSSMTVGGWDTRRNIEWRVVNAASPGSLVAVELEGNGRDAAYGLMSLGLLGDVVDLDGFKVVGVNMLLPVNIVLGDALAS